MTFSKAGTWLCDRISGLLLTKQNLLPRTLFKSVGGGKPERTFIALRVEKWLGLIAYNFINVNAEKVPCTKLRKRMPIKTVNKGSKENIREDFVGIKLLTEV